jgi:hypothetical protein
MRLVTLLGRIGTVILAIGLALLIAWLMPSGVNYKSGWVRSIEPEEYTIGESQLWSPQNGLQISVDATDNVRVYILGVGLPELDNWKTSLREAYPDSENPGLEMFIEVFTVPLLFFHEAYPEQTLKGEDLYNPQTRGTVWNVTVLDKGLETHPEIVLWDPPPGSTFSHELFPEDILSIVAVVANPASDTVEVDLEIKEVTAVAPKDRIIFPAILLMSLGFGLTIAWLVSRSREKFDKARSDRR